jgi:hypothetical protein
MDEDGDDDDEWSPGSCSIALFPFWCLDAKGGEVVLLGCPRGWFARVGHKRVLFIISWELVPIYRVLFALSNLFGWSLWCGTRRGENYVTLGIIVSLLLVLLSRHILWYSVFLVYCGDHNILSGMLSKLYLRLQYIMRISYMLFHSLVSLKGELEYLDVVHLYSNANYLHALI